MTHGALRSVRASAGAGAAETWPRNSGLKPSSLVSKKKSAEPDDGVDCAYQGYEPHTDPTGYEDYDANAARPKEALACQSTRNAAGSRICFCAKAPQSVLPCARAVRLNEQTLRKDWGSGV